MDIENAREFLSDLRVGGRWRDPLHIATNDWWEGIPHALSKDPQVKSFALVEIRFNRILPDIDDVRSIMAIDGIGIWFEDDDRDREVYDPTLRQRLIPWHVIDSLTLHQAS